MLTSHLYRNDQAFLNPRANIFTQQHYLATRDLLTGLHNKKMFVERVEHEIKYSERYNLKFAFLLFDINNFRQINETVGSSFGDLILKQTALRLKSTIRVTDTLARLKDDQFILLLTNIATAYEVAKIAEKILSLTSDPILLEGQGHVINSNLSICLYPNDGVNINKLLDCSFKALSIIKNEIGCGFQFYNKDITKAVNQQVKIENTLRRLLANDEYEIKYQPIVDVRAGEILQLKASLQLKNSVSSLIPVDILSDDSIDQELTDDVNDKLLLDVCEQIKQWKCEDKNRFQVIVELSKQQLLNFGVKAKIEKIIGSNNVEAKDIAIEIRQQVLLEDYELAAECLNQIKALGISITISDFGNGLTDINFLKNLPIDNIKFGKLLVENIEHDKDDQIIAYGFMSIATMLGISVMADGVKNTELLSILSKLNCYRLQGDIIHQPLPADQVVDL